MERQFAGAAQQSRRLVVVERRVREHGTSAVVLWRATVAIIRISATYGSAGRMSSVDGATAPAAAGTEGAGAPRSTGRTAAAADVIPDATGGRRSSGAAAAAAGTQGAAAAAAGGRRDWSADVIAEAAAGRRAPGAAGAGAAGAPKLRQPEERRSDLFRSR